MMNYNDIKIAGVTCAFNESQMVKYVMPYWERIKPDKLIVYDNMSTDNMCELLSQYSYVEIRKFDTEGKFSDETHIKLKSETAKELADAGYDWIYIGDFDEILYTENENFREVLYEIQQMGGNVFCRDMVLPFATTLDVSFDTNKLPHQCVPNYITSHDWSSFWGFSKVTLIHKSVPNIRFNNGCHQAYFPQKGNADLVVFGYPIIGIHLKYIDWNVLEKNSHDKHDRIQWRIPVAKSKVDIQFTKHLYSRSCGMNNINNMISAMKKKFDKVNVNVDTTTWDKFKEYYDNEYDVTKIKFKQYLNRTNFITKNDYETNRNS